MPTVRQRIVASATRRYPFYSGCGRLANHPVLHRIAGQSSEVAWARVHGGYRVAAPLADHVGRAIFYLGELDRKITWVCSRLVQPGDTVLDIGANLGLVTFTLSALVGPAGTVHAFEPIPQLQTYIEEGIERNGVTNIQLHRMALGARDGELPLAVPRKNAGASSLVETRQSADSSRLMVPVRTLSSVLTEQEAGHVRLIKMDVEGFEPEVLEGAADFFKIHPPDAILFELNDVSGMVRDHRTIRLLSEYGYGFFSLPRRFTRMRAQRIDAQESSSSQDGHDYVAARLGPTYDDVANRLLVAA
jgi:FkbM family methyltransferase